MAGVLMNLAIVRSFYVIHFKIDGGSIYSFDR